MINRERLKFPTGTASAALLASLYGNGREAIVKARALGIAGIVAFIVPLLKDLNVRRVVDDAGNVSREPLLPGTWNIFDWIGRIHGKMWNAREKLLEDHAWLLSEWHVRFDHSLVLLAAGSIIGIRATFAMLAGSALQVFAIGPRALAYMWTNPHGDIVTAAPTPAAAFSKIGVWYGAPLLVAYGLVTFALQWRTIARAFASLGGGAASRVDARVAATEVPSSWFVRLFAVAGTALVLIAWIAFAIPPYFGALAVLLTFLLGLVACRATGETDITPGGPLGKIMQLTYGVIMRQNPTANLMTAAVTSGAGLASADLLTDLKSGYLLGAHPRRQFVAQFLGIFTGTCASYLAYSILVPNVDAIRTTDAAHPAPFVAPGAQQWEAVARVFADGIESLHPMARNAIAIGVAWGVVLALAEAWFPKHKKWIPSATGLGLGLLLPFFESLSFAAGAAIVWIFTKANKTNADRYAVPVASGLIAGESIVGIVVQALNNFVFK
jgi:uncharacterized oligopeptide transporter (OPT) family protein